MLTARGTKWSASSVLYAYGSPCFTPHRRSAGAPASTPARAIQASRRELRSAAAAARSPVASCTRSAGRAALRAVGIDGVVAARIDEPVAGLRDLVVRVVADVDDRLEEHGRAEREHRYAASLQAVLERVRVVLHGRARLAAGDDVALRDRPEDPARVGDELVVREREQWAATK